MIIKTVHIPEIWNYNLADYDTNMTSTLDKKLPE